MAQDPLMRSVDPHSMRLQLARRNLSHIADHAVWKEAGLRLNERISFIRMPGPAVLDYGIDQFGEPIFHKAQSLDVIVSVGLMAYLSNIRATLAHWAQLLRPEGLLMFCTLGPDTFHTLAQALGDASRTRHIPGHPDMHDLGDALVSLSLANPVMDSERLWFSYSSPQAALADIRLLGGNSLLNRPAGLSTQSWRGQVLSALEDLRQNGKIMLPVELVFGHAWAAQPKPSEPQAKTVQWVGGRAKNASRGI